MGESVFSTISNESHLWRRCLRWRGLVEAYWEIGKHIVDATGERATCDSGFMRLLSERLTAEFGKGFTERNLRAMRQFYEAFPNRHTLCADISWSHYRLLIRLDDPDERSFYLQLAAEERLSVRELSEQIDRRAYWRTLSTQKAVIGRENAECLPMEIAPADNVFKDPYVLDFLDLSKEGLQLESSLEQALIDSLEKSLLELGRGFTFYARQKRVTDDGDRLYAARYMTALLTEEELAVVLERNRRELEAVQVARALFAQVGFGVAAVSLGWSLRERGPLFWTAAMMVAFAVISLVWIFAVQNARGAASVLTMAVAYGATMVLPRVLPRPAGAPPADKTLVDDAYLHSVAAAHDLLPRETEVFMLLAQGRSRAFIQDVLSVSEGTVKTHTSRIYQKPGVAGKQELLCCVFDGRG